jgi:predicted GNAT family acetyltransferase
MQLANVGRDPRTVDAAAHAQQCLERIHGGFTHVIFDGARLVFKVDVGSRSRFGAHIEGMFTVPQNRGQGIATKALGQICRTLLSALPRLTLHVDSKNRAAHGLYRKLGFADRAEVRLLIAK